jgi:hypothetical protein
LFLGAIITLVVAPFYILLGLGAEVVSLVKHPS